MRYQWPDHKRPGLLVGRNPDSDANTNGNTYSYSYSDCYTYTHSNATSTYAKAAAHAVSSTDALRMVGQEVKALLMHTATAESVSLCVRMKS
jgi:hypothetical protein